MAPVTHIVAFQFKPGVTPEQVKELVDRMIKLKETCLHPVTKSPYITSVAGGKDNSVQGLSDGFTHVFVVRFSSLEDRTYYALTDPVHLEFVHWSDSVAHRVYAIDFTDGVL